MPARATFILRLLPCIMLACVFTVAQNIGTQTTTPKSRPVPNRSTAVVPRAASQVSALPSAPAGYTVYAVFSNSNKLATLDLLTGSELSSVTISLPDKIVLRSNGLARHPDGRLYALLAIQAPNEPEQHARELAIVDPATGAATDIGPADDVSSNLLFADITFAPNGTLYGITGHGSPSQPDSLFTIDPSNGHAMLLATLTSGDYGDTIAFNPLDGLIYHATNFYSASWDEYSWWETWNPASPADPPVALPTVYPGGATALTHWTGSWFLWSAYSYLYLVDAGGSEIYLSSLASSVSGVAISGAIPASSALTVTTSGTGTGKVISEPAGIECGTTCTASFPTGSSVVLTATADPGFIFGGWDGACWGYGATCTMAMPIDRNVNAIFSAPPVPPPGSLYMISPANDNLLRLIDPSSGSTLFSVPITMAGNTVQGGTGLAANPVDGKLYALLSVQGTAVRQLATLTSGGIATLVGPADDGSGALLFNDITFAPDGTLYGVTASHALFRLDTSTGFATLLREIPLDANAGFGDAIAYNPTDGLIYYATSSYDPDWDVSAPIWETVDPSNPSAAPVLLPTPWSMYDYSPAPTALLRWYGSSFLWAASSRLFVETSDGSGSYLSTLLATAAGLAPAAEAASEFTLTVTKLGVGTGTVTSEPAGVNCGSTCSASFSAGSNVRLTAKADPGSTFQSWSGCSGYPQCQAQMFSSRTVYAYFGVAPETDLRVSMTGPSLAGVGGNLEYEVIVLNGGPGSASNIVLTDTLPPSTTFVYVTSGRGCSHTNGVLTCTPGFTLSTNDYFYIRIVVTADVTGTLTNSASATADVVDTNLANNSASVTTTVSEGPPDTSVPSVSLTAPTTGSTVSGSAITVSASATDNVGVAGVQFKLDGAPLGAEVAAAPYAILWDTTKTSNGQHTLTADARDAAGNHASASITVTVSNSAPPDSTAPTVTLAEPGAGAILQGSFVVSAIANDNVGVAGVQFKLDGGALGAEVTTPPYVFAWDTTKVTNGAHTLSVSARDAAGNVAVSASLTVTVTNSTEFAFSLPAGTPASATMAAGGSASFSLNIAPSTGFTGPITFTSSGVPPASTITIVPNPVTVSGTLPANIMIQIATTQRRSSATTVFRATNRRPNVFFAYGTLLWTAWFGILVIPKPVRRRRNMLPWLLLALALLLVLFACGGGGSQTTSQQVVSTGTPAGAYTVTITGNSGVVTHSFDLHLTVN